MILLDTHAFVWLTSDNSMLPDKAKAAITEHALSLCISSITALEIALLVKRERLILPLPVTEYIEKALSFHEIRECLPDRKILIKSAELPDIHNDPFDRIIIATALVHDMPIITKDRKFTGYPNIITIWE